MKKGSEGDPFFSLQTHSRGAAETSPKFECNHLSPLLHIKFFTRAQSYFVRSTKFLGAMLRPLGSASGATASPLCVSPSPCQDLALQSLSSSGTRACLPRPAELPVTGFHSTRPNPHIPGNCEFSLGISYSISCSLKAGMHQGGP